MKEKRFDEGEEETPRQSILATLQTLMGSCSRKFPAARKVGNRIAKENKNEQMAYAQGK